jgi:hypothetical protein
VEGDDDKTKIGLDRGRWQLRGCFFKAKKTTNAKSKPRVTEKLEELPLKLVCHIYHDEEMIFQKSWAKGIRRKRMIVGLG